MIWSTHLIGGLIVAAGTVFITNNTVPEFMVPTVAIAGVSALLPDMDMPGSKVTNTKGFKHLLHAISTGLNKAFGHRGFIHSPLLYLLITLILYLCNVPDWLWIGFLCGTMSHLILDTFNPGGIPWLWPKKKHYHIANIKTRSLGEKVFAVLESILLVILLYFCIVPTLL